MLMRHTRAYNISS